MHITSIYPSIHPSIHNLQSHNVLAPPENRITTKKSYQNQTKSAFLYIPLHSPLSYIDSSWDLAKEINHGGTRSRQFVVRSSFFFFFSRIVRPFLYDDDYDCRRVLCMSRVTLPTLPLPLASRTNVTSYIYRQVGKRREKEVGQSWRWMKSEKEDFCSKLKFETTNVKDDSTDWKYYFSWLLS